jgi:hypothetical protein
MHGEVRGEVVLSPLASVEPYGSEEIGPRMHWATHLLWPDDTISRRTNH